MSDETQNQTTPQLGTVSENPDQDLTSVSQNQTTNQDNTTSHDTTNDVEDEKIDVQFGVESDEEPEEESKRETTKPDLSKYTVVDADHLDEDAPIKGQEFCLFSFMSPEGIMNCNVRAVKFRGAYPTMAEAEKKAKELEKTDKYFKIFIGDSGKWLDFDPPVSRVDREMSTNREHQKILDHQRKQRMDKINALAGKHKELTDKKENGKTERIQESKKAGAASDAVDKQRTKKQEKLEQQQEKQQKAHANSRVVALDNAKARLRKRLEASQNKKALQNMSNEERTVSGQSVSGQVVDTSKQTSIDQKN